MARLQAVLLLALALCVVMASVASAHQQQGLFGSVDLPEGASLSSRLSDLVQRRSLLGKNKYLETYVLAGKYGSYSYGYGYGKYGYYSGP